MERGNELVGGAQSRWFSCDDEVPYIALYTVVVAWCCCFACGAPKISPRTCGGRRKLFVFIVGSYYFLAIITLFVALSNTVAVIINCNYADSCLQSRTMEHI